MKEYTCCFSGSRPHKLLWKRDESSVECVKLKYRLFALIEEKIKIGYNYFISGMAQGFDIYCAEIVLKLKKLYPEIKLECAIPYKTQSESLNDIDLSRYLNIVSKSDCLQILSEVYTSRCLMDRNMYMVNKSSLLICFYNGDSGGTKNTYDYAARSKIEILNLFEGYN